MQKYDDLIFQIGSIKNRYSIVLLILMNVALISPSIFGILFILLPTNFRCHWSETLNIQNMTQYMDLLVTPNVTGNSTFDNQCSAKVAGLNKTVKCQHFIYETNTSMVSEFDLVCDKAYWINLIKGSFWVGYLLAAPVGLLADKIGRKTTIIILSYMHLTSQLVSAFAVAPWMYYACHLIKGFSSSFSYIYVILQMEISNVKSRHIIVSTAWTLCTVYNIFTAPLAYMIPQWRHFELVGAGSMSMLLIIPFFFPESPRWLLVTGKTTKAQETLDWLAVKNKCPKVDINNLIVKKTQSASFKEILLNKPILIRVLFSIFLWYSMNTIYYGICLNVKFASSNPYISHFALSFSDLLVIPLSIFVIWLTTYKRAMYALISCTVTALFMVYFIQDYFVPRLIFGSFGKITAYTLFVVIITFTEELYPTEFRTTGHNLTNLSRLSVVIVPYIIDLKQIHEIFPVLFISAIGILMMISIMPFPETKGWPLPQTINELRKIKWSNVNQPAAKFTPNVIEIDLDDKMLENNEHLIDKAL